MPTACRHRGVMITRQRDLDAFAYGDVRDVRIVDDGDGLAFALVGMLPARRTLLPAVYGLLTLQNGVPIGYSQVDVLAGSAAISFNTFPAFRGGETAYTFARLLATAGTLVCQAHATAQALVAYRSAYLATHQPLEFFTALLNHSVGQPEKSGAILRDAVERGVRLLDVDIQRSGILCAIESGAIRLGLTTVRHIGEGLAGRIAAERATHGPFQSLHDCRMRLPELPRRAVHSLIAAGAFESLGVERGRSAGAAVEGDLIPACPNGDRIAAGCP